jgi:endonuclease/exonuclease/phosphatase family metal-dependent hydrolase
MAGVGSAMTSAPTITVASYNMRKAIGTDRRRRPER